MVFGEIANIIVRTADCKVRKVWEQLWRGAGQNAEAFNGVFLGAAVRRVHSRTIVGLVH